MPGLLNLKGIFFTIVLIIVGFLLIFAGIVGCILPVIPGPPLSFVALILLSIAYKWRPFSPLFLTVLGIITAIATVMDYLLPILTAKRYGASKFGIWGSIIGMIIGIVIFPPYGLIIGAFLGALFGELIFNKDNRRAANAGLGIFMGTMLGIVVKLSVSGVIAFFFVRAVLTHQ